jgi:hypothetical protein
MKLEVKESTLDSGCLALFILFVTILLMFPIGEAITVGGGINRGEAILLIIYYLVLTVSCFFIVKKNPTSIWYVPLICNAFVIIAVFDSSFWRSSLWILLFSGFALSIIASIIGALIGKRTSISDEPQYPNDLS